jgi:hypothetical protein
MKYLNLEQEVFETYLALAWDDGFFVAFAKANAFKKLQFLFDKNLFPLLKVF